MNPGFERNGATWGHYIPAGGVEYSASYPNAAFTYATDSWAFGYAIHEGMHCARLHNRSGVRTYVTLPDAGLYRLTLHIRARADEVSGLNPVRAYIVSPSGATNAICRIKTPFGQNFTAYSHLFRADEAGRHWLHIEGEGVPSGILDKNGRDSANKTTLLDGVSVVKVDEAAQTVPSMPGKLRIDVAEGARLALDYPGTVKVGGVRLGGARAAGIVDAATHPDYVSGIGALEVVPGGTMLMFK